MAKLLDIKVGDNLRGLTIHFTYPDVAQIGNVPTSENTVSILKTKAPNSKYITGRDEGIPEMYDSGSYNIITNILTNATYSSNSFQEGLGWIDSSSYQPIDDFITTYTFPDDQDYIVEEVEQYYDSILKVEELVVPEIKGLAFNQDNTEFLTTRTSVYPGALHVTGNVTITGEVTKPPLKIVTFADGTDEEIKAMLEAHYNGDINIEEYWHVGDTRKIHIDATNSGNCDHVAQNMTMVIMDFNHDDLTTPINKISKAAVSVGFRETMGNNGTSEDEYYWCSSYYPVKDEDNYSASPLRTWLNEGLLNALPSTFSSIIKEVNKKNLQYHTKADGAPLITKDKIWLLSYPEIFGTQSYSYYKGNLTVEGEQYQYFATSSNRIKYPNKNGEKGSADYYWLRSPSSGYSSGYGYYWCNVYSSGSANLNSGDNTLGFAPAFCL